MEDTVQITITSCEKCPSMANHRFYTADSFEHVMEWKCRDKDMQRIALHEWNDPVPAIPKWCPLRK